MVVIARKHLKESRSNKAYVHKLIESHTNHTQEGLVGRLGEFDIVCGLVYDSVKFTNHCVHSFMMSIVIFIDHLV